MGALAPHDLVEVTMDSLIEFPVVVELVGCLDDIPTAVKVSLYGFHFFETLQGEDFDHLTVS